MLTTLKDKVSNLHMNGEISPSGYDILSNELKRVESMTKLFLEECEKADFFLHKLENNLTARREELKEWCKRIEGVDKQWKK